MQIFHWIRPATALVSNLYHQSHPRVMSIMCNIVNNELIRRCITSNAEAIREDGGQLMKDCKRWIPSEVYRV